MTFTKASFVAILAALSIAAANPINPAGHEERSLFNVNPGVTKRTLFNIKDIKDKKHQEFLKDAQKEAVEIAATALKHMDDEKYENYLKRWFGDADNVKDDVKGVLTNFVGDNKKGEGSTVLGDVNVWQEDYWKPKGQDKMFCDIEKDGRKGTAYYTPKAKKDKKPGMHFCDKFFERKDRKEYLKDDCKSIGNIIDTEHTTRSYRGSNVLHEFMHFEKVGKAQYVFGDNDATRNIN